ncbi:hypothetical protein OO184_01620 [Photorhabdus sp. APURE]|uniref:hypothetical protein n=1 Tax=Photorhabdus aballayi TaxID=2991723 RepID=UPI00223D8EB8|nr:hypothetical protein [Photorhabdus aballayi]MCW7546679.1 hypothetical protein [Photorhabdus aballayi]
MSSLGVTHLRAAVFRRKLPQLQDIVSLSASKNSFSVLRANGERLAWDVGNDNIVHSEYDD